MRPTVELDPAIVRENARAWRARAGTGLRAVVKADGYGWGAAALIEALDEVVDGYYVADVDEFDRVRARTARPIAVLGAVGAARIVDLCGRGGIPTVTSLEAVRVLTTPSRRPGDGGLRPRVRLALRSAVGWSGIEPDALPAFAAALAESNVDVEVSAHVTDPSLHANEASALDAAVRILRTAGVAVVGIDLASTAPLAAKLGGVSAGASHVRVGVGVFGARCGGSLALASAIRVRAPLVDVLRATGQRVGYGLARAPAQGRLAVLRCGYGDGFPRLRDGRILAVGMQFTTIRCDEPPSESVDLIDQTTDLDALAERAGVAVHQLVATLGLGARRVEAAD